MLVGAIINTSSAKAPMIDFQAIYFAAKRGLAAKNGYRTDPWYAVKQPRTERSIAKNLWASYKIMYAKSMVAYLDALKNYVRDPGANTRKAWAKYGAIIDFALTGWSDELNSTETNNFWTSLAAISLQLNAVQGVPTNNELLKQSIKECVGDYGKCLADAKRDLGLPELPNLDNLFTLMKWGTIGLAGVWVYSLLKKG